MCWGADMPNLVEWMPLGGAPGCREAAMDPQNIKLFGQTISVVVSHHTDGAGADAEVLKPGCASPSWDAAPTSRQDGTEKKGVVEKLTSARSSSGDRFLQPPKFCKVVPEYGTPTVGSRLSEDSSEGGHSDELKDQSEGDHSNSVGNEKILPKPDKVVPCPRCDSLDTKFCYYNNYNVNQPRHFCKNCQRYWTAGGTLRNVPVGAGRRKNKHGSAGLQRESCSEASASPLFSAAAGSPTSQKAASCKQSNPKRIPGQNSPMRNLGSASSFGQESGITILSPQYSLHTNGRLPFQASYSSSQGFMTSGTGTEASAVTSPDSASTPHQITFPSGNGFDKDCSRSALSVLMQDVALANPLSSLHSAVAAPMSQQLESPATYRSVPSSDMSSIWAGNDAPPRRFFNGDYPNGYPVDWDGKQHSSMCSSHGGASFSTPAQRIYSSVPIKLSTSSWNPDLTSSQWPSNVDYASHPQWHGAQPTGHCISEYLQCQPQPGALHKTLGKRGASDVGREDVTSQMPAKMLRIDEHTSSIKCTWPMMLKRTQSDVNATLKLFQPKLELPGACEHKDNFRLFNSAAARPVPFPVTT